ncbi:Glycosyltransferase involved in cell wall bisynthesis [Chryseobacterium taichungense]|uniref:Glycosyltransferase involved in cell wall bisynthesis n=1 Tax=Chryseobacterium taichungense TaxID=295069 RepID=A0A1H7ZHW6_9FLAO|nr:glycosyltransferase [Chryseobacterium taichungense]SEM57564.1 Glycosyltransferase involved in cell wall bisynthesis [Chryseobacterium taichungense]
MKFSILIANYNNGKYFKDCFQSLLSQNYQNWEAIILDDASTDNSVEVIKKMVENDERFRIYHNETNSGVGVTKSRLIELAEGEICGFVDPDDAILPTAISSSIKIYQKKMDVVLTYSLFTKCDGNLNPQEVFNGGKQVINQSPCFFNSPIEIAHFVTFKKKIYNQTEKMDTSMKIAEDQDLYLKMYEKGKVYFINESNYLYRMHSGGISQNENKQKSREYFAQVIFNAMKRRNLKNINGRPVPGEFENADEIYSLLEYQNTLISKIKRKVIILIQQIFN